MSHFQKIHSATNECEGIGQQGGSEMAWGCVLEGSESSPGERWGSGNGSRVDVCPMCALGRKDAMEGWKECASQRRSSDSGTWIYILHKDAIHRPH